MNTPLSKAEIGGVPGGAAALRALLTEISRKDASNIGIDADLVRELGLDSLAALRMLAAVEKRFQVRFPDERLAEFRTLRRLLEVVGPAAQEKSS